MLPKGSAGIWFRLLVLGIWLILPGGESLAQRYQVQTYSEQDGVSSSAVFDSAQDSLGRIWFATRKGLTVYNGIEWREVDGDDPACPHGEGLVYIDDHDHIWWAAKRFPLHVARYVDGHWQDVPGMAIAGKFWGVVDLVAWTDSRGVAQAVVATGNGYLRRWNGQSWVTMTPGVQDLKFYSLELAGSLLLAATNNGVMSMDLRFPGKIRPFNGGLPPGPVYAVSHDPATGIAWIIGDQWLARMKNWQLDHIYPLSGLSIKDVQHPVSACQDGYGGVYFVYYAQILYFHPQGGPERITPVNGVVAEGGYHVMRDRENNIWITGMRGISQIISRRLACYDHNHGLQGDEVSAICRRASGTIVLGHRTGLTFLDSSTRTLTFGNDSGIMSRVIDLAEDARGDLWVAADRRGLGLLQNDGSLRWFGRDAGLGDPVYAILPDVKCPGGETALFVGTSHGLYKCTENRFEKVELRGPRLGKMGNICRLVPLADGGFAMAGREHGLFLWREGRITNIPGDSLQGTNNTYTVYELSEGNFWVGTAEGLCRSGPEKLELTTSPDPEIRRPVYSILRDDSGWFWFGTDDGVIIWDGQRTTRITSSQGLLGNETNRDALKQTPDGRIWIGTESGVSVYRREFDTTCTIKPVLYLQDMRINGTPYPVDRPLRIQGPLGSLALVFRSPVFANAKKLEFRARITGGCYNDLPLEIRWPGQLNLTNVHPGHFQIQVQARLGDHRESNILTTPLITIVPPLRDRWYTKTLMILGMILLIWLGFAFFSGRRYARRLEEEVRRRTHDLHTSEETAHRESERLVGILESISDGVIAVDPQKRVILHNRAAETILPNSLPLAPGKPLAEILPVEVLADPRQARRYEELLAGPADIRIDTEQLPLRCRDGRTLWYEFSVVPISGTGGGLVFAFRDITDRHRLEQQELRTQKLESLGLLAGGIAHDFNNLLTIMLGNINLLENSRTATEEERGYLTDLRQAVKRAASLTLPLLTFAKGGEPVREPCDLVPLVRKAVKFNLSGSNVECRLDLPEDLWWAEVDQGQISQAIGNLVINGSQAMPNGGLLKITARNIPGDPGHGGEDRWVIIEIEDHGVGIPQQNLDVIFDPYFTTKENGSGLGLAITHSIADKHGGRLTVDSTPGRGSIFRLELPACPPLEEAEKDRPTPPPGPASRSCRILVMDDERDIRRLVGRMLHKLGHVSEEVAEGSEAVTAFKAARDQGRPFDLVILDLTIPGGMGGLETAAVLKELDSDVPLVVASGYSDDPVVANAGRYGFSGILRKPFAKDDLQRVVEDLTA